jgi:Tfp pilus assembly PilM family ATPase
MIFSRKKEQAVIFLSDTQVKYVSLSKRRHTYHIETYEQADLKPSVFKNGEVLEMEFLSQILSRIQKHLNLKHVDVLLPHHFFVYEKVSLDMSYTREQKMRQAFYKHVTQFPEKYPWITTHSFELMFYKTEKGVDVHIQMLSQENYRALVYTFEKAGFTIGSVHSEDFSFRHIFQDMKKVLHIRIYNDSTRLGLFDRGVSTSNTDIDFSYQNILGIYAKYGISPDQAQNMLEHHGFLSTYNDQSLYRAVSQPMTSLLLLLKDLIHTVDHVYVSFESYVIPGVIDTLQKSFHTPIQLVDPLHFPTYLFNNIRSIHAQDIPDYTTCILYILQKIG